MTLAAIAVPGRYAGERVLVGPTPDGIQDLHDHHPANHVRHICLDDLGLGTASYLRDLGRASGSAPPDLVQALLVRALAHGMMPVLGWALGGRGPSPIERDTVVDCLASDVLVTPRSERWREAVSTALLGNWCEPLWDSGHLPTSALGALKTEVYTLHRQLVPVWRRRTRHGRVLSLDAPLGDGLSLHDLVAAGVDHLRHTPDGVFEDERLTALLDWLAPAECAVLYAYAEGEATTWTEAAAVVGATDPIAFGERVRRKAKRLADEQRRRAAQRRLAPTAAS